MKDAYWLGVDYGVIAEAKRLGVKLNLVEAGGYTELNKQISQIEDCVANGSQAVIIGAISADGLNNLVKELAAKKIPVIDVINGINSPDISAKSLVSFYTMGHSTGEYLAAQAPCRLAAGEGGLVPRACRRRLGRGRQQRLPRRGEGHGGAGSGTEVRRHRQGGPAQAR